MSPSTAGLGRACVNARRFGRENFFPIGSVISSFEQRISGRGIILLHVSLYFCSKLPYKYSFEMVWSLMALPIGLA